MLWLPKIYKEGYPLRIIVTSINSPLFTISRFFLNILKNALGDPESHVTDSFTKIINNTIIETNETFISLNVVALFNNIFNELDLKVIKKDGL